MNGGEMVNTELRRGGFLVIAAGGLLLVAIGLFASGCGQTSAAGTTTYRVTVYSGGVVVMTIRTAEIPTKYNGFWRCVDADSPSAREIWCSGTVIVKQE